MTRPTLEVAIEVKLLAWREAEHYPTQFQELLNFLPTQKTISPRPQHSASWIEVKEEASSTLEVAELAMPELDEQWMSDTSLSTKTKVEKRSVLARRLSFRENLSGMLADSSGHLKNMALSFGHDDQGGSREVDANINDQNFESSSLTDHNGVSFLTNQDQKQFRKADTKSSIAAARNCAKARARLKSSQ